MPAPIAKTASHSMECHGHVRVDPYYWMRDRENSEVIEYLEAENAYAKERTAHTEKLQGELFEEIKGRIQQTDESVPYRLDGYYYYSRFEEGREYPIYCRKKQSLENSEEIMIDANELAEGHDYCSVSSREVADDRNLLAYAVDTVGRRIYTIYIKNLATGELLPEVISDVTGNLDWASDNKTLFYSKQDPETLRSHRIYRHVLGTDPAEDVLVYEETDETFRTFVYRTKSKKYLIIASSQTVSDEYRILDASNPSGTFTVIEPRRRDHEYTLEHFGDYFYIKTNHRGKNFSLMRAPVSSPGLEYWEEVIPHRDDVLLEDFEIFRDFMAIAERRRGLIHMRLRPWSGEPEHEINFGEPAYHAYFTSNHEFDTDFLRYRYTSLTTPVSTYDYHFGSREKTLLKRDKVLGNFDSANYVTERLHATAPDGILVPISLVYHKDKVKRDGASPLLLGGYGSYGISRDPVFSSARLSLLDRGFVYAIGHIRGGEELGRQWYDDGKLFNKKNTFTDFIACGEHLAAEKYADPKRLYAQGGSAGGLLMGAVINLRPDLFHGALASVPFVDVVTTMLDESIPLTTFEYDEWGDPRKKEYYDYILSYSPYDNVKAQDYPNLLVMTGLHDSQVQYWEPSKWVAKLRVTKTDDHVLLFKTEMGAGHAGPSGRYEQYKEIAFQYAFLLDLAGLV